MNDIEKKCQPIRAILSDVDGVLTEGSLFFIPSGEEIKCFNIRDELGIRLWQKAGHQFGLISGRSSHLVQFHADDLGLAFVRQGVRDKRKMLEKIMESASLTPEEVCFIGDDFPDLSAMKRAGIGATVADAPEEIRKEADWISTKQGGKGAVRELIEMILKAQNCWNTVIQNYLY
ncbi:MAG: HAD hydrolase family protein [Planctomycetia bacterium]|nr:HAD hydrolase family protein [Planctomycetia bacterium]